MYLSIEEDADIWIELMNALPPQSRVTAGMGGKFSMLNLN